MIEDLISELVESPTEDNKQKYLDHINKIEYDLLVESDQLPFKSREYYEKRIEAFSYRRESAMKLINSWISKYGTSENCVVSYADTLNIPFQQIKKP